MNYSRKRVYQYINPKFKGPDDDTRWIAASTPEAAQEYAREHGWLLVGNLPLDQGPDEIFNGTSEHCRTAADFKRAGCDVVLP